MKRSRVLEKGFLSERIRSVYSKNLTKFIEIDSSFNSALNIKSSAK